MTKTPVGFASALLPLLLLLSGSTAADTVGRQKGRFVQLVGESQLDKLIDEVIYEQGQQLIKAGKDKIRLPDFHKRWERHVVGKLDLEAEVHLENGWFRNTTSLYRIGDVQEKEGEGGSMTFSATFGIQTAQISHEDFNWKFLLFKGYGDIDAECKDNAVSFQLTIKYDENHNCDVNLDKAELTKLGGFSVTFEPIGFINKIKSKLFTCALNAFAPKIKIAVNAHLQDALRAALQKIDICSKLPF